MCLLQPAFAPLNCEQAAFYTARVVAYNEAIFPGGAPKTHTLCARYEVQTPEILWVLWILWILRPQEQRPIPIRCDRNVHIPFGPKHVSPPQKNGSGVDRLLRKIIFLVNMNVLFTVNMKLTACGQLRIWKDQVSQHCGGF